MNKKLVILTALTFAVTGSVVCDGYKKFDINQEIKSLSPKITELKGIIEKNQNILGISDLEKTKLKNINDELFYIVTSGVLPLEIELEIKKLFSTPKYLSQTALNGFETVSKSKERLFNIEQYEPKEAIYQFKVTQLNPVLLNIDEQVKVAKNKINLLSTSEKLAEQEELKTNLENLLINWVNLYILLGKRLQTQGKAAADKYLASDEVKNG